MRRRTLISMLSASRLMTVYVVGLICILASAGGEIDFYWPEPEKPPNSAPTLTLTTDVKQLHFTWTSASNATFYILYWNPDGVSGFKELFLSDNNASRSYTHTVTTFDYNWAQARYVVHGCNTAGCGPASNIVDTAGAMLSAIGYFKTSNTDTGDRAGWSIAVGFYGSTIAIGAPLEASSATGINGDQADNSAPGAGAVYVFAHNIDGSWSLQAYLKASNADAGDNFGYSVALSGDMLAVGAPFEASSATGINGDQADNSAPGAGAVYVFTRSGTSWSQQAYLKASNTGVGDSFGYSVALGGYALAVGAPFEASSATGVNGDQTDNSAPGAGAAYNFAYNYAASEWSQQAYLKASNTDAGDNFGHSVLPFGDKVAVGAPFEASSATGINGDQADNSAPGAGAVYVFMYNGSEWSHQAYLKASNTDAGDNFGYSLGGGLAVGAPFEASSATGINGDQADNSAPGAGAVYVFGYYLLYPDETIWSQQAYLKASNTDAGDNFGYSVALGGGGLLVGAPLEASGATILSGSEDDNSAPGAGAVYVFTGSGTSWSQRSYVKATNTGAGDHFGHSVGGWSYYRYDTLLASAPFEASSATGVNKGNQADNSAPGSGASYLY